MFSLRDFTAADAPTICGFARSAEELFSFIPAAAFPLTPDQLLASARVRECSTVVLVEGRVAAYANIYDARPGEYCFTGNVVVDPAQRGRGVGNFLLAGMEARALREFRVREHRLTCVAANTRALLWYGRLGYRPYGVEERKDFLGRPAAMIHMAKAAASEVGRIH